jgi:hypothetical protein
MTQEQEQEIREAQPISDFIKECREVVIEGPVEHRHSIWVKRLLEACKIIEESEARLKAMYRGDLSPESRLNGYKVVTDQLRQQRDAYKASRKELLEACELGLNSMRGLLEIGVEIGASNKNKRKQAENIKQVEAAITNAKKEG